MGTHSLITVLCPACSRGVRTMRTANVAICVCGHRIDAAFAQQIDDVPMPAHIRNRHLIRPPNAWRALHRIAIELRDNWSPSEAKAAYVDWLRSIPTIGCNCDRDWRTGTRKDPPDFSSPDAFARWAWRMHNSVRKRLGQVPWSWEDSQAAAMRPVIGFLAAAYMPIGGTETFHRALLPRLHRDGHVWVDGFVVTGEWDEGDLSLLGVPGCGSGINAARALAARVDVLLVWGIMDLAELLPTPRPRVIAVHHSDTKSTWSHETISKNRSIIDLAVTVHPDVTSDLLGGVPNVYIANAVDRTRYMGDPSQAASLREQWNIRPTDHVHLWVHRWSPEKRPELALEIAARLPDGHVLVMVTAAAEDVPELPQLRYVGTVRSPADWLATSSTFLSTSTYDGFGTSMAEAMGAGVPVVGTAVGIAAETGMAARIMPQDATPEQWTQALVETVGASNPFAQRVVRERHAPDPWAARWADMILETYGGA